MAYLIGRKASEHEKPATSPQARALRGLTLGQFDTSRRAAFFLESHLGTISSEREVSMEGLHIFVDKGSQQENVTDIVAIHGLNGNYENTWTAKDSAGNPINWLRDLLPQKVPNARVMSLSYNSAVQFSKSTSGITQFAHQLLEQLHTVRGTTAERKRPIIFICHSLGGIVFKQAINIANSTERYHRTIYERVIGVAFFGTPHRGSKMANWGSILSSMLKAVSFSSSTNSYLTKDLELNSRVLELVSAFPQLSARILIYSFYETEKMPFMKSKVVESESAILGWPNETRIPLPGNHRSICWFTDLDEPSFRSVWTAIQEMIVHSEAGKRKITETKCATLADLVSRKDRESEKWSLAAVRRHLKTSDFEAHKNWNRRPVPGTCTWIVGHEKYRSWISGDHSSLLWLSADAGYGKSVLTSLLIDHQRKSSALPVNVLYFFFKADNAEQSNAVRALAAVLYQLLKEKPGYFEKVRRVLGDEIKGSERKLRSARSLWEMIVACVDEDDSRNTLCFFDGLDECEKVSRGELISLIEQYYKSEHDADVVQKRRMRVFIASRPENYLKKAFDRNSQTGRRTDKRFHYATSRLRGEDEVVALSHDIELVVKDAIADLDDGEMPVDLLQYMEDESISRADRTFLWVTLIMDLIRDHAREGMSRRHLDRILQDRSVYSIYTALLSSTPDNVKTRKMLSIILGALIPMTVQELSVALAIEPDHETFEESAQRRRPSKSTYEDVEHELAHPFENYIKRLGGNFVRIIQKKVFLVHQTAREYLLDHRAESNRIEETILFGEMEEPQFYNFEIDCSDTATQIEEADKLESPFQHTFNLNTGHAILLELCVTFLYMGAKWKLTRNLTPLSHDMAAFWGYAAQAWPYHFSYIKHDIRVRDLPYYHGLCHPLFPDFHMWVELHPQLAGHVSILSDEDKQDYILHKLGIGGEIEQRKAESKNPFVEMEPFSNPTSLRRHYFPIQADETGFVWLKPS